MLLLALSISMAQAGELPFEKESIKHGIPSGLLASLCFVESSHNPKAINKYDNGSPSIGVCQLKKTTASIYHKGITEKELLIPAINISIAAQYLSWQYKRYGRWDYAIVAYNAGSLKLHSSGLPRNVKYLRKVEKVWIARTIKDIERKLRGK